MSLLHGVLFGIGMLILFYLGVKNAGGVAQIFKATGDNSVPIIKVLQGR